MSVHSDNPLSRTVQNDSVSKTHTSIFDKAKKLVEKTAEKIKTELTQASSKVSLSLPKFKGIKAKLQFASEAVSHACKSAKETCLKKMQVAILKGGHLVTSSKKTKQEKDISEIVQNIKMPSGDEIDDSKIGLNKPDTSVSQNDMKLEYEFVGKNGESLGKEELETAPVVTRAKSSLKKSIETLEMKWLETPGDTPESKTKKDELEIKREILGKALSNLEKSEIEWATTNSHRDLIKGVTIDQPQTKIENEFRLKNETDIAVVPMNMRAHTVKDGNGKKLLTVIRTGALSDHRNEFTNYTELQELQTSPEKRKAKI